MTGYLVWFHNYFFLGITSNKIPNCDVTFHLHPQKYRTKPKNIPHLSKLLHHKFHLN